MAALKALRNPKEKPQRLNACVCGHYGPAEAGRFQSHSSRNHSS